MDTHRFVQFDSDFVKVGKVLKADRILGWKHLETVECTFSTSLNQPGESWV